MNKTAQRAKKRGLRLTSVRTTPADKRNTRTREGARSPNSRRADGAKKSGSAIKTSAGQTVGQEYEGKGPCGVGSGETRSEELPDDAEENGTKFLVRPLCG